ncbi:thiol-activated cytolysin family protein [Chitinophaga pendula]|uniref:thiol-activated cytolysin family protein n=1 Tax=Chitinophaga TaxID=79328 RepID=UPI000BB09335|nr:MULTISPECIES: thiol-activated cytolysin family protein [Chitinophaga]ASZ09805.1 hypothetical protein CK934_01825 [Chitinophaga sp. MD30]UCJ07255.1 thiol-activated cytolysin family protein [Chitinophaga pendula]
MKTNLLVVLSGAALLFASCEKKLKDISPEQRPLSAFSHLPKFPEPLIRVKNSMSLKDYLADIQLSPTTFIKDSFWAAGTGKSVIYESTEQAVLPDNEILAYPGSIIRGNSISTMDFIPIAGYIPRPIRVGVTFPTTTPTGTIASPSLSETRVFLRNSLLNAPGSGKQISSFSFELSRFTYYEEIKQSFGSNAKVKGIFSSSSSSSSWGQNKISKSTGVVLKFTQKNFDISMDIPRDGQLIDPASNPNNFGQYSPVYVSSVTYGRMGIIVIESNYSFNDVNSAFSKVTRKLFKSSSETLTTSEQQVIDNSEIQVFIVGGHGETEAQAISGYDSFVNYVAGGGEFSAADPGVPIAFTLRYLSDHSLFKTRFQVDFAN